MKIKRHAKSQTKVVGSNPHRHHSTCEISIYVFNNHPLKYLHYRYLWELYNVLIVLCVQVAACPHQNNDLPCSKYRPKAKAFKCIEIILRTPSVLFLIFCFELICLVAAFFVSNRDETEAEEVFFGIFTIGRFLPKRTVEQKMIFARAKLFFLKSVQRMKMTRLSFPFDGLVPIVKLISCSDSRFLNFPVVRDSPDKEDRSPMYLLVLQKGSWLKKI